MRLKANTTKSAEHLRVIAGLVNTIGIILGVFLEIVGLSSIFGSSSFIYIRGVSGFISMIIGLLIMFWHYVVYVIISAYATIIENSDRTDVVAALFDINDTLHSLMVTSVEANSVNRKSGDYTKVNYYEKNGNPADDVELEKIDISSMYEE